MKIFVKTLLLHYNRPRLAPGTSRGRLLIWPRKRTRLLASPPEKKPTKEQPPKPEKAESETPADGLLRRRQNRFLRISNRRRKSR